MKTILALLITTSAFAGETNEVPAKVWTEIITNETTLHFGGYVWKGDSITIDELNRKPEEVHTTSERTFDVVKLTMVGVQGIKQLLKSQVIRQFKIVTSYTIQTNVETIVTAPVLIDGLPPREIKGWREQLRTFKLE